MYARCPHCETVFSISAAHLRSGRGQVRCGTCLAQFDAMASLSDDFSDPALEGSAGAEPAGTPEPPTVRPDALARDRRSLPGETEDHDPVPHVLRDDLARVEMEAAQARHRPWYAFVSLLLAVSLSGQWTWFRPEQVIEAVPRVQPHVETFCARTGCRVPERYEPSQIQLLNREVRIHPRYEGALQINATLVNRASFVQSFPRVSFTLYNVNGRALARRTFTPGEYLIGGGTEEGLSGKEHSPQDARMAPNMPRAISLDLLAPDQAAISFEFKFL